MVFKKWHKPVKKWEKVVEEIKETTVVEEENTGTTLVEEEINTNVEAELTNTQAEKNNDVIWNVGWAEVHVAEIPTIKFETFAAPVPIFMIKDEELRQYLINTGFWTDVWRMDKEWLEKHWADMKMIERLKKYLSENYRI